MLKRRDFIRSGAVAAGTLAFNPAFLRGADVLIHLEPDPRNRD